MARNTTLDSPSDHHPRALSYFMATLLTDINKGEDGNSTKPPVIDIVVDNAKRRTSSSRRLQVRRLSSPKSWSTQRWKPSHREKVSQTTMSPPPQRRTSIEYNSETNKFPKLRRISSPRIQPSQRWKPTDLEKTSQTMMSPPPRRRTSIEYKEDFSGELTVEQDNCC
eukprot:scaffold2936_cov113-Cylindrotheca_fusiformis.AAC.9